MNIQNAFKTLFFSIIFIFVASISKSQTASNFKIISSAFEEGKPIPAKYTCDGSNISPPLTWSGFPKETKSFAIIMDDLDAPMGIWVHWVVYNIPSTVTSLNEKNSIEQINAIEGLNSWNEKGYNGPCPPGGTHRYSFKLYALDKTLAAKEGMTKDELLEGMKNHMLGEAKLTGLFRTQ